MQKIANKLAVLAASSVLFLVQVHGQTVNSFQTNVTLNARFSLTAYSQNYTLYNPSNAPLKTAEVIKIVSGDIINAVGASITNTFPSTAKLMFKTTNLGATNQHTSFIIRNGTNDVDITSFQVGTNVVAYLDFSFPETTVSTVRSAGPAKTNSTDYSVLQFSMNTVRGNFDLRGFTILSSASVVDKGRVLEASPFPNAFTVSVAGSGALGGKPTVFRGTVTVSGRKVEIVPVILDSP